MCLRFTEHIILLLTRIVSKSSQGAAAWRQLRGSLCRAFSAQQCSWFTFSLLKSNSNQRSKTAAQTGEQQTKLVFIGLKSGSRPVQRALFLCRGSRSDVPSPGPQRCPITRSTARPGPGPAGGAVHGALPPGTGPGRALPDTRHGKCQKAALTWRGPGAAPGRLCPGSAPLLLALRYPPGPRSAAASRLPPSGLPRGLFIPEPSGRGRGSDGRAVPPPPPGRSERRARSGAGGRAGFKRRAVTPHKRFR